MGAIIPYLTPLFAIYLVLVSSFAKQFIKVSIHDFVAREKSLEGKAESITAMATGWATRLSVFNAMLGAFVSLMVIFSKTRNYELLVLFFFLLLLTLGPTFWFLVTISVDSLDTTYNRFGWKYSTIFKAIAIVVNVLLIIAIYSGREKVVTSASSTAPASIPTQAP